MKHLFVTLVWSCLLFQSGWSQASLYISNGGSMQMSGASSLTLSNAKLLNEGQFSGGTGGTVFMTGNAANNNASIDGMGTTTFQNLTINKSANAARVNFDIQVNGSLDLQSGGVELSSGDINFGSSGSLQNETEANRVFGTGGSLLATVTLNAPTAVNPANLGFEISSLANLGSTQVKRSHGSYSIAASSFFRNFEVIPANNTSLDATIKYYYLDAELNGNAEGDAFLWKSEDTGSTWMVAGGAPVRDASSNWLQVSGIPSFSLFAAAGSCPSLTTAPVNVSITNSSCDGDCTISGGLIAAPTGTPCPFGSEIQYQVDGGTWSTTLPVYAQMGPAQSIATRCVCELDPTVTSPASVAVLTVPGTCPDPTPAITVAETSGTTANDGQICAGDAATLTASGGTDYLWSTGETSATIMVTPGATSTYTVTVTANAVNTSVETFNYTGGVQTYTVPAGVTSIEVEAWGASGASGLGIGSVTPGSGGLGGYSKGTLTVIPGQVLNLYVGGAGSGLTGGFNGGSNGGSGSSPGNGGGGGGASDVRIGGTSASDRVLVAGGGGGGGATGCETSLSGTGGNGGSGGGLPGGDGGNSPTSGGFAGGGKGGALGTGGAPGAGCSGFLGMAGSNSGVGGNGQNCCCFGAPVNPAGGGGGGGYINGGGGGGGSAGTTACSGNDKGGGGGGAGGSNYVDASLSNPSLSNGIWSGNGKIQLTLYTIGGSCSETASTTVSVTPLPSGNITVVETSGSTPNDGTICIGASATLTAPIGQSYAWSSGETTASITVTPSSTTSYDVTVTTANSCTATMTMTITVNPLPTPSISVVETSGATNNDGEICLGGSATLTASGGTDYVWSTGETTSSIEVMPGATTAYTVTVTDIGSSSSSQTYDFTGAVQMYTVPAGVTSIQVEAWGASGASGGGVTTSGSVVPGMGGLGGYTKATMAVTPGQVLQLYVGGAATGQTGGYNGGSNGGSGSSPGFGGGGGGATDIRVNGTALSDRVLVAGGGGGGGARGCESSSSGSGGNGGAGGGVAGSDGAGTTTSGGVAGGGFGGTLSMGGAPGVGCAGFLGLAGNSNGQGGNGQDCCCFGLPANPAGGGGGGGYQNGGGGGGGSAGTVGCSGNDKGGGGGGAGGSNYVDAAFTDPTTLQGIWAGNGKIVITTFATGGGCSASTSSTITVTPLPVGPITVAETSGSASNDGIICIGGSASLTAPVGQNYSWSTGATTASISVAPTSTTTYTVTVTNANNCLSSQTVTITVNPLPTPTTSVVESSGTTANDGITCSGATVTITATGGTTYVWSTGATTAAITVNPVSTSTYTVTVTNANGCSATTSATITVNPAPTPTTSVADNSGAVANDGILCLGGSATLTAAGGTAYAWSTGATTAAITVSPAATTTYTVTVTNANGCSATATRTVTVTPLPTLFAVTGGGAVCSTDNTGVPVGLSGSQVGINYQLVYNGVNVGSPVAGTGAAISFGTQLPAGAYTVVATNTSTLCVSTMTGSVSVTTFNCSAEISDPCACLNNATTLTNGQFSEQVKVNAPTSQTWTVTAVNGLFASNSANPPSAPTAITVGTVLTNVGGNMFTLNGRHIDALGYTITVSNGLGTSLSIGNTCSYPNPSITSNLTGPFCLGSEPVALTGNPGDANIVSQGFTVNGVPSTAFNPAQGLGAYTIVYTVNGGQASGNDPGCIQSISTIVNVVETPSILVCNELVHVSLDEDCSQELTPDMILEGNFVCYDDYFVSIDRTQPLGNGPWVTPAVVGVNDINKTWAVKVTHEISGNSCWGLIKVEDKLAPVPTCTNFEVSCAETNLNPSYLANTLGIAAAFPSVVENCGTYTQSYSDVATDFGCNTNTNITANVVRTWVVKDASGNESSCSQTINIISTRVSDVQFPADATVSCGANANTSPSATGTPFLTFNYPGGARNYAIWPEANACELQAGYSDQILPICDGSYKILRTWTVYDWCVPTSPFPPTQNPQYYIQLIKVLDESAPSWICPEDMTVSTNASTCCANVDLPNVVMTDNCSRINKVEARVEVYDQYTGDLIATHDLNGTLTTFAGNNLWDRDTMANFGFTPCLPVGTHKVTYTAYDDCGNYASCQFDLTVEDQTPPVAVCDEWTQVALINNGTALVDALTYDDGSYDNCGPVYFKVRRMDNSNCQSNENFVDQARFCCEDVNDTIQVILRVYDVNPGPGAVGIEAFEGDYNDCMVNVLVEDKIKPICTAPANVTVSCEAFDASLWAYGQATAVDNCSNPTITGTVAYNQFDSLCNKGTITRRWTAVDAGGNTSSCSQRIVVTYNQNYYVKFPDDRLITTCDGTGNYGQPEFYGAQDCELMAVSYTDELFTVIPDACFKIERTWTVLNWCQYNPNGACIEVPNPEPNAITNNAQNRLGVTVSAPGTTVPGWEPTVRALTPGAPATNFSSYWNKEANCYKYKQIIKVIDTQDPSVVTPTAAEYCDYSTNDANMWNAMYWYDNTINSHDLCEGDANIELTATDACSGANIRFKYLLFLDLDGNGSMETVVNSNNSPGYPFPVYNNVQFDNANTQNYLGGESRAFDFRPVPANQKWGFGIQTDAPSGNNRTARVRWVNLAGQNTVPQLPYGTHKIKWFVEDGCGNETVVDQEFIVKDCKKPTVVCLNGLSVNLMNISGGMVSLFASDFLQYTEDNCTPSNQLTIAIRRSGTGTGFPVTSTGAPQTEVTFTCADLGTQLVELWSIDKAGNADYCETYVLVQDNAGICGPIAGMATVAGALETEAAQGVEDATIELNGSSNGTPVLNEVFSNVSGSYLFSNALPIAANATVTPIHDVDPLNGVNTWDLVLISRHILGLDPLNSPYKLIAADANKSGTVTTFDIVELRKLILGTYTALPNNNSWRFVDAGQQFTNNDNPFADVIRENLQIAAIQNNILNGDFVGVKVGDVDQTAVPNTLTSSDDRTAGTLLFDVADRKVAAGEEFVVNFKAAEQVSAYQFTLNFRNLEVMEVVPGAKQTLENFGIFENAITTSADATPGEFAVRFRATANGTLSQLLSVSSQITKAVAFEANNKLDVAIRFNGANTTISGVGFELYQNTPNPWVSKTQIGFHLPEAAEARLTIYDAMGRILYTAKGQYAKGYNVFSVDRKLVEGVGNMYYKVETATDTAVKQMIQMK